MEENFIELMNKYMNDPNIFKISSDELRAWQNEMLRVSFKHHYENCSDYRKYCEIKNVDPSMIQSLDDIHKVPLLDSEKTLRKREFFSVPEESVKYKFSSSGSTGETILWSTRDETSFEYQLTLLSRMAHEVMNIQAGETLVMVPDMPNAIFSQVFKALLPRKGHKVHIGLAFDMKDGKPNIFPDAEAIEKFFASPSTTKNIIGYPFTVAELKKFIDSKGLSGNLGENGTVMTAGGWKAKSETMPYAKLSRPELEEIMSNTFGVPTDNIKDVYGCSETLGSCWECLHYVDGKPVKNKHVSPWTYMLILDPDTLEPVEEGQPGRAAFMDFAYHAHPGFILTDDILRVVSNDGCACGRPGQVIEFVDRVASSGERGCAFVVRDKLFSEEYVKDGATGELESGKEQVGGDTGVISYVKEYNPEMEAQEISANISQTAVAMEAILEVLKMLKVDESIDESLAFIDVAKHLCYKKGVPQVMDEQELLNSTPGVNPEQAKEVIDRLDEAGLFIKEERDGKIYYSYTKKADELGEAMFPMFIWAVKWANPDES